MKNLVKKMFTKEDLKVFVSAIGKAEKTTAGEIRISIRQRRRLRERGLTIEQLARKEFLALGMTKTKDRTGVLIFLLLQDKQFFILADEGIHCKVEEGTWEKIASEMSQQFSQKNYRDGIVNAIHKVGDILSKHFPRNSNDTNELSDEVHMR